MIPHIVPGIRVQQRRQRAAVDDEPGDEGAKLLGGEQVDLEHARVVRADGPVPQLVDAQLRELAPHALPQLRRELRLERVALQEVDVHVEAAAPVVGDGRREGGVGVRFAPDRGRVDEGFAVLGTVSGRDVSYR